MSAKGHIIAIGGGGFGGNPKNPIIEDYIVQLSSSKIPKIAFFPTASAENKDYVVNFYKAFSKLNCNPEYISLFQNTPDLNSIVESSDIIYIGGGNTKSMLAVFREWNLDQILLKAYSEGKILCGVSAGAICWFEKGITDSWEGKLRVMDCLNFLPGVCCPHYDGEEKRRPAVENFIKTNEISRAICIEDGAAIHYKDSNFQNSISFYPNKNAYDVYIEEGDLKEVALDKIDIS
tara:strand:- start:1157 stop:1858 length:702 start_codon:yes stop_codon:yes gene_type:complete